MFTAPRVPTYIQRKRRRQFWENVGLIAFGIVAAIVALSVRSY